MKHFEKNNKSFEEIKILMKMELNFGMQENLCNFTIC